MARHLVSSTDTKEQIREAMGLPAQPTAEEVAADAAVEAEALAAREAEAALTAVDDDATKARDRAAAADAVSDPADEPYEKQAKGARRGDSEARISDLIAQKRQLERTNAALLDQIEGLKPTLASPKAEVAAVADPDETPAPKPKQADFETWQEFDDARDQWRDTDTDRRERLLDKRVAARVSQQVAPVDDRAREHHARLKAFAATTPDFPDVIERLKGVNGGPQMIAAIERSKKGPEILYHFGHNLAEVRRIAALDPVDQVLEISELTATLSKPAPAGGAIKRPISNAPNPPTLVRGGGGERVGLDKLSGPAYRQQRRDEERRAQR